MTIVLRLLCMLIALFPLAVAKAQSKIEVVASFSILADITAHIGGERVHVSTLVPREADAHVFQPAPQDARRIARAGAVIINGLGFEGWMERLIKAAGGNPRIILASQTTVPLKSTDPHLRGLDPHAWHDVATVKSYVATIRDGLSAMDPDGQPLYQQRAQAYLLQLDQLDAEIRASLAEIPPAQRIIVTSHDAFGYYARAYGIRMLAPQGVSTETEASAKDIAKVIKQIRAQSIPAVILENVSDPRLLEQIARETGAKIGGKLYSDSLSLESGPAATYIELMRHNTRILKNAMMP
jgi:zinc/manganese transport system substrate-binding protein